MRPDRVGRAVLALLGLLCLGAGVRPAGLGDVTDVRVSDHDRFSRVVIELSSRAHYRLQRLSNPARLFIDIDSTWIDPPQREARASSRSSPLISVRGGQNTLRTARVVLELDRPDRDHRIFFLEQPFRIVTDVFAEARPASEPGASFDARPVRRVILDPGHGGKDPGASGRGRLREKDVVLRTALRAKQELERAGLEVFLTRSRDVYLTLEDRTRKANELGGDLFVSIHANASPRRSTQGIETYLLDTRYDRQTARVAARENGTTVDALNDLQLILASLRLGYNERYAARLAQHVHRDLTRRLRSYHRPTRDLGVKRGPFLVLFQADMPAVLVELGFLSNRGEAKRMRTDAFVQAAAEGIARGILAYRGEHARGLIAER
jgi:N-acetylmuramoyl-L-alanine amidase